MCNYNSIMYVVFLFCLVIFSLYCLIINVLNDESNLNIIVIYVLFEKKNIVNIYLFVKNKIYRYLILLNDIIVVIKLNKLNIYKLFDL